MKRLIPTPAAGGWMPKLRRRGFLTALGALTAGTAAATVIPPATPSQTEGPFFPDRLPEDQDNDLLRKMGADEIARGEVLHLSGQLYNVLGERLAGAEIEIWQCDAGGRYLHSGDRQDVARDEGFQGYGRSPSDAAGFWSFRTIRPVAYPGRTPHIHMKIHHPGGQVLTTQLYIAGEPDNERDGLYRRLEDWEQELVTLHLEQNDEGDWSGAIALVLPWG